MTCVTLDIRQAGPPLHQCRGAPEKSRQGGEQCSPHHNHHHYHRCHHGSGVVHSQHCFSRDVVFSWSVGPLKTSKSNSIRPMLDRSGVVGRIFVEIYNTANWIQFGIPNQIQFGKKFVASTWKLFPNWIQFGIPNWIQFRKSCDFKCSCITLLSSFSVRVDMDANDTIFIFQNVSQ